METKNTQLAEDCACEILAAVPRVQRHIRSEMRRSRGHDLSVPQFRTLAYLTTKEGASLSDLAENIGLTLPSSSKLVDGLVARKFVQRKVCANDRRRVTLSLTGSGRIAWQVAYQAARTSLAMIMMTIPPAEQETILRAMVTLNTLFQVEKCSTKPITVQR